MLEVVWFFLRDCIYKVGCNGFDLPVCVIAMIHRISAARSGVPVRKAGSRRSPRTFLDRSSNDSYKYSRPMLVGLSRDARAAADLAHADIAASTAAACSIAARKCGLTSRPLRRLAGKRWARKLIRKSDKHHISGNYYLQKHCLLQKNLQINPFPYSQILFVEIHGNVVA